MDATNKTLAVRYWEEITKNIDESIGDIEKIALLLHNSAEFKDIAAFLTKLSSTKVAYISMTKTFDSVKDIFYSLSSSSIFIDCISGGLFDKPSDNNCVFKPMPNDVNELLNLITQTVQETRPEHIIVDSLSQFIDFSASSVNKDSYTLIKTLNGFSSKTVFLYDETQSQDLTDLPITLLEKIFRVEIIRKKYEWNG